MSFVRKICGLSVLGAFVISASSCDRPSFVDKPEHSLMMTLAPCAAALELGQCLIGPYVNHPASIYFPESEHFRPIYDQVMASGYDREQRRKLRYRSKKKHHKNWHDRSFLVSDMFLHARAKTPASTQVAIDMLRSTDISSVDYFDSILQLWTKNSSIYDDAFTQALLDHYSKKTMLGSSLWDLSGMEPGQSPHEFLMMAYDRLGDKNTSARIEADWKTHRSYPLAQYLKSVNRGLKNPSQLDVKELREKGFSAFAIMPWINRNIEKGTAPRKVLIEAVFAIEHGFSDRKGDDLVEKILGYAYDQGDYKAIKQFADKIVKFSEPMGNGIETTLKRSDRLSQDVVLAKYLTAIKDKMGLDKLAKKWDILSTPLADGKLPAWSGTSSVDYAMILYHAGRADDFKTYVKAHTGNLMSLDDVSEKTSGYVSRAVTVPILEAMKPEIHSELPPTELETFYNRCAREKGIAKAGFKVREYCIQYIDDPEKRVIARLVLANDLYEIGSKNAARSQVREALKEANDCGCVEDRPQLQQNYYIRDIIANELGGWLR